MGAVRDATGCITDFRYEYCNRAALNVLGRQPDQLIGQRLLTLFPSLRDNGLYDAYTRVVEAGYPLRDEFEVDENGVAGEFEVLICPFGDGVIVTAHDISDRKSTERQLKLLAEQLQGALNSRVIIEQAKGYLAARSDTDLDVAFKVIRRYARDHNQRLRDVAEAVVAGRLDLGSACQARG